MRIARVQIGVTCPAARVEVGVKFTGPPVAVGTLIVPVTDVALRSRMGVEVCVAVDATVFEITGEAEGEGVSVARAGVSVSVTAGEVAGGRAVKVCAIAVLN